MLRKFLITVAAMAAALPAMAAVQYTNSAVTINGKPDSDFLGKVDPATPVDVLSVRNGKAKVRISGWTLAEYPSMIFTKPNVRIQLASFDEEKTVKTVDAGSVVINGNKWVKATAEGYIDAKVLVKNVGTLWKQGKARHSQACSSCHGAPHADHFTANQWASLLPVRGGRTGHSRAGANQIMFKYLQNHAKAQ